MGKIVKETIHAKGIDINRVQFEAVKNEAGLNRFVMTPIKQITQMNAIGIVSKAGRYGGTYAHSRRVVQGIYSIEKVTSSY